MVFFTCDYCNESLKKNQVEKHVYKCRNCASVTCIDCSLCFYGNDYTSHITCISEAEKYEKSLHKGKQKLSPQEIWMQAIANSVQNISAAPSDIRQYVARLSEFGNIPRNKKKFSNFLSNSLRLQSQSIVDSLWDYLNANADRSEASNANNSSEKQTVQKQEVTSQVDVVESEIVDEKKRLKKLKKEKKRQRENEEKADEADQQYEPVEVVDDVEIKEMKHKKKHKRSTEEEN